MPILEALDNDGKRTGRTRMFTQSEYERLLRYVKRPKWILVENDKPKPARKLETPTQPQTIEERLNDPRKSVREAAKQEKESNPLN